MKKAIYFLITALILCIIACSEDFTTNPDESLQDIDTFFLEEANAEEAVIGIYDLVQHTYGRDWHSAFLVKLLPGDDANAAGGNSDDQTQLQDIDDHTSIAVSNVSIQSVWDLFYRTIALSNVVIDNVTDSSLSNKDLLLAEAKFFRAWSYFELTTMFGDIPLRVTTPKSAGEFAIATSTRAEIYAQIESDLTEAIAGLPDKSGVSQDFRVSKGAAQGLMGKALVFQEKYSESLPYFQSVINNVAHDLESNSADIWSIESEYGIESLFETGYIATSGRDWGNIDWGGRTESNLHVQLMGPRGDGIFDVAAVGLINGWGFNLPTSKLVDAFEDAGDTVRKAATLMTEEELIAGGGSKTDADVWDYEGAIRLKYATRGEDTSKDGVLELNYSTNFRLFRYAEVLLLAAEAYNKAGQDGNSRTELNKVRKRAGLADVDTSLSGDALFEAIVDEKFLELAHEGQRFWDLVRWGKASTELAGTGYTSKNDLFPIPITEIDKNSLMTEADQNPGY